MSSLTNPAAVASNLDALWSIFSGVTLVSERDTGRILELSPDGSSREIGFVADVVTQAESGLLGLAIDDQSRLYDRIVDAELFIP